MLNNRNLKYILSYGYDKDGITLNFIYFLIENFQNNFLEIILNHYILDNKFIINFYMITKIIKTK